MWEGTQQTTQGSLRPGLAVAENNGKCSMTMSNEKKAEV